VSSKTTPLVKHNTTKSTFHDNILCKIINQIFTGHANGPSYFEQFPGEIDVILVDLHQAIIVISPNGYMNRS
jgi:hypothetical protein